MQRMKIVFTGLLALMLHGSLWAQDKVYESRDARGNAVFSDTPTPGDKVIDLQQTNVIDAQAQQSQPRQRSQPQQAAPEQAPIQGETPVIVNDAGGYDDGYNRLEEGALRRQRELEAADPETPHEVGDSMSQMPHEVGDSGDQAPDEVGDFDEPPAPEIIEGGAPERHEHRRR